MNPSFEDLKAQLALLKRDSAPVLEAPYNAHVTAEAIATVKAKTHDFLDQMEASNALNALEKHKLIKEIYPLFDFNIRNSFARQGLAEVSNRIEALRQDRTLRAEAGTLMSLADIDEEHELDFGYIEYSLNSARPHPEHALKQLNTILRQLDQPLKNSSVLSSEDKDTLIKRFKNLALKIGNRLEAESHREELLEYTAPTIDALEKALFPERNTNALTAYMKYVYNIDRYTENIRTNVLREGSRISNNNELSSQQKQDQLNALQQRCIKALEEGSRQPIPEAQKAKYRDTVNYVKNAIYDYKRKVQEQKPNKSMFTPLKRR